MTSTEFQEKFNNLHDLLFAFAMKLTRDTENAKDLMQETACRAFKHRMRFKTGTNFKAWCTTIMRNTFINDYRTKGVKQVLCTDISKDGMLEGTAIELYAEIMQRFPDIYLIASGGVTSMDDLDKLNELNVPAAVIGKAIYEGNITLKALEKYMQNSH